MESTSDQRLESLQQQLSDLEKVLESPIVPGEMCDWLEAIHEQFELLSAAFAAHCLATHRLQLRPANVGNSQRPGTDETSSREDGAIAAEISRLTTSFAGVARDVATVEQRPQNDEGQLTAKVMPLVAEAIALIIRTRMQENTFPSSRTDSSPHEP